MDEIKEFKKEDISIMKNLIGKKVNNIFKQLDFFILNFGEHIEYSLHTYAFLRIKQYNKIILTSSDEFYLPNYERMPNKLYKKDELHKNSLLHLNLCKAKEVLKFAKITNVEISETADIYIFFDNKVVIELIIDCQCQNFEFFRFFENNREKPHYVVKFLDEIIYLEKIYADNELLKRLDIDKIKEIIDKFNLKM